MLHVSAKIYCHTQVPSVQVGSLLTKCGFNSLVQQETPTHQFRWVASTKKNQWSVPPVYASNLSIEKHATDRKTKQMQHECSIGMLHTCIKERPCNGCVRGIVDCGPNWHISMRVAKHQRQWPEMSHYPVIFLPPSPDFAYKHNHFPHKGNWVTKANFVQLQFNWKANYLENLLARGGTESPKITLFNYNLSGKLATWKWEG